MNLAYLNVIAKIKKYNSLTEKSTIYFGNCVAVGGDWIKKDRANRIIKRFIELGFLTNKAEGRFLNTRSGQIKMAKAIAKAIKKYIQGIK